MIRKIHELCVLLSSSKDVWFSKNMKQQFKLKVKYFFLMYIMSNDHLCILEVRGLHC